MRKLLMVMLLLMIPTLIAPSDCSSGSSYLITVHICNDHPTNTYHVALGAGAYVGGYVDPEAAPGSWGGTIVYDDVAPGACAAAAISVVPAASAKPGDTAGGPLGGVMVYLAVYETDVVTGTHTRASWILTTPPSTWVYVDIQSDGTFGSLY